MHAINPMDVLDAYGESLDRAVRPVLEAWRLEKKVYTFESDLSDALRMSRIEDKVPPDYFRRLPAPCVFIHRPSREVCPYRNLGFFAHAQDGYLDLVKVNADLKLTTTTATLWANSPAIGTMYPSDMYSLPPLISLLLYLCERRWQGGLVLYEGRGVPKPRRWVLDETGLGMIWASRTRDAGS